MDRLDPPGRRLVLVGMMGSGKSAVGRAVATRLGWPYLDNDDLVRQIGDADAPTVAATAGVDELHRLELAALDVVLGHDGPLVASVAAFVVVDPEAARRLRQGATVAWLRARPDTLRARIAEGRGRRSEARSIVWLAETSAARERAFAAAADIVIDVDERTVESIAAELAGAMGTTSRA